MAGGSSRDRVDRERTRERDRRYRDHRHSKEHHSRRSPEYCRNDSDDDDMYDDTRRHRSNDHDPHESDRKHHRRDRSRSRDRNRDRDRYYDDYNDYNDQYEYGDDGYERDKDKERAYYNRDRREEIPNNTIMVRGLSPIICENDIILKLAEINLQAKDIRLMRNKETGTSRGFAFVEFTNINDAILWKDLTQGVVNFSDDCQATVHYSIPKDSFGDKNIMKNDWCCYKCGVNNFKRREQCFKCGTPKEESIANDTGDEISLTPTNCLLLRNLSQHTTEERILTILGTITALPIKSIRILKDPIYLLSRGVCLVELHTTLEASQLFTLLLSMSPGFIIDDNEVSTNYGKRNATTAQINNNAVNAAIVALAAAQWTNQKEDNDDDAQMQVNSRKSHNVNYSSATINNSNSSVSKSEKVTVNGVEYSKYPTPDVASYQYDESSGYYYDASTGFYYDANTQYYYNSQIQKYMYWDSVHQTYLPADTGSGSTASAVSDDDKKEKPKDKHDKVKIAKKIAKDMEKWAKTLNQKKETARTGNTYVETVHPYEINVPSSSSAPTADAGFTVFDKKIHTETPLIEAINEQRKTIEIVSNISESFFVTEDPMEILKTEERRLTDWDKLACLLCKRQFSNREQLNKHQQLSDLHKSNMFILRRTKLSDEQIEELERNERDTEYRDRAKERRKKYGPPELPEPSKLKTKYLNEIEEHNTTVTQQSKAPLSKDNIGNKMLKAMGWSEGMGLGKSNQGMSNIIEVERRSSGAGLGIRASTGGTGESYKDAVRRTMQQRFKELSEKQ